VRVCYARQGAAFSKQSARNHTAEAILRDRPELAVDVREDGEATDAPSLEDDSVVGPNPVATSA
jgi:hypothetical protein